MIWRNNLSISIYSHGFIFSEKKKIFVMTNSKDVIKVNLLLFLKQVKISINVVIKNINK